MKARIATGAERAVFTKRTRGYDVAVRDGNGHTGQEATVAALDGRSVLAGSLGCYFSPDVSRSLAGILDASASRPAV